MVKSDSFSTSELGLKVLQRLQKTSRSLNTEVLSAPLGEEIRARRKKPATWDDLRDKLGKIISIESF